MPRLSLVHSFLDRFEERLEVDCERLKHQLLAQVDQQFGVLRTKVTELRSRFCDGNRTGTVNIDAFLDDPPVETVPLDQCNQEKAEPVCMNQASTSTGRKRKCTKQAGTKQKKARTGSKQHICKYAECGKSFAHDFKLAEHERIHLNIKPFSCTWPGCGHSAVRKDNIVEHVRIKHFKLPKLMKDQTRLNIVDNRNPEDYIRVDNQLLERRLE